MKQSLVQLPGDRSLSAKKERQRRALIGKIVLTPEAGREDLRIDLHGDLAGILSIASQKPVRPGKTLDFSASGPNKMALEAGAGF